MAGLSGLVYSQAWRSDFLPLLLVTMCVFIEGGFFREEERETLKLSHNPSLE